MGIKRERLHQLINKFLERPGSGLTYVRGRRRIGKSYLLKQVIENHPNSLYFVGAEDSTTELTISRFIKEWSEHSKRVELGRLRKDLQTWDEVFNDISKYLKDLDGTLLLVLDEIQWIARQKSGFVGLFKATWEEWKSTGKIKVILCGSSNHFFASKTGGDLAILRGLKTYGEIWVEQFSLQAVHDYYFPDWTREQVALIYMLVGGIPYYLEQFIEKENFIRSVNSTLFSAGTIFLDEIDEILKLDFNRSGVQSVKKVLSAIQIGGSSFKRITEGSTLSKSSVSEYLHKLEDYRLVFRHTQTTTDKSPRFYMKDFFLHCYFQLLRPLTHQILQNVGNDLVFPHRYIGSKSGYYIPEYSGEAFELLVRTILERREDQLIIQKLNLRDPNYLIDSFYMPGVRQVDLIVTSHADREIRLIECKWLADTKRVNSQLFQSVAKKTTPLPKGYSLSRHVVLSKSSDEGLIARGRELGVGVIGLEDLF